MEMNYFPSLITIIALCAAAVVMYFSWLNQKTYKHRIEESKKLQQDAIRESREVNQRSEAMLGEMVQELKAIRQLLEKKV